MFKSSPSFTIVFCDYLICVSLLRETTGMAAQRLRCPSLPAAFALFCPDRPGRALAIQGEEGHALGRKRCPRQSPSTDGNSRTASRAGLGRGRTLQSPKFPGAPTGPKLPLSRRSGAAGQLWGSSAAQLRPAAQMRVFAQPSPRSEAALLGDMKGGL